VNIKVAYKITIRTQVFQLQNSGAISRFAFRALVVMHRDLWCLILCSNVEDSTSKKSEPFPIRKWIARGRRGCGNFPKEERRLEGKAMFCVECGASNPANAKFCNECGKYITVSTHPSERAEPEIVIRQFPVHSGVSPTVPASPDVSSPGWEADSSSTLSVPKIFTVVAVVVTVAIGTYWVVSNNRHQPRSPSSRSAAQTAPTKPPLLEWRGNAKTIRDTEMQGGNWKEQTPITSGTEIQAIDIGIPNVYKVELTSGQVGFIYMRDVTMDSTETSNQFSIASPPAPVPIPTMIVNNGVRTGMTLEQVKALQPDLVCVKPSASVLYKGTAAYKAQYGFSPKWNLTEFTQCASPKWGTEYTLYYSHIYTIRINCDTDQNLCHMTETMNDHFGKPLTDRMEDIPAQMGAFHERVLRWRRLAGEDSMLITGHEIEQAILFNNNFAPPGERIVQPQPY
jgi:hypothetical protein